MLFRKQKQDNLTVIKSKKPILKQGLEQFIAYYFKKIFTILAIATIPLLIIGCIVIAILSVILWFLPNTETSNNIQTFFLNSLNVETVQIPTGGSNIVGGIIGWAIDSFCAILYLIFIRPIVWLLGGMQDVVYFIGGEELTKSSAILNNLYSKDKIYKIGKNIFDSFNNIFSNYDYVLIDYPPTVLELAINFLIISDLIIMPINNGLGAFKGILDLKNTLNHICRQENSNVPILKIVFNNVKEDEDTIEIYKLLENEKLNNNLLQSVITNSKSFIKTENKLSNIWENIYYWRQKQAYEELIKEIK